LSSLASIRMGWKKPSPSKKVPTFVLAGTIQNFKFANYLHIVKLSNPVVSEFLDILLKEKKIVGKIVQTTSGRDVYFLAS
jgi:hypothetical protein